METEGGLPGLRERSASGEEATTGAEDLLTVIQWWRAVAEPPLHGGREETLCVTFSSSQGFPHASLVVFA